MTGSSSRQELLQTRLTAFTQGLHGLDEGRVRSVHRTRVAARRLRELLPILQLERSAAHDLGRRLRRATRRLGILRELDALLVLVDSMRKSTRYDQSALDCVFAALTRERDDVRSTHAPKVSTAGLSRLAARLEKEMGRGVAHERQSAATHGWIWAIDARLRHRADGLKAAMAAAGQMYVAERLHAVRIGLKKFRYAVELQHELSPSDSSAAHLNRLKHAQRLLGRLHDLQVLIDRVRQIQASLTSPDLEQWRALQALMAVLENECRRLHARYVRDVSALMAVCDHVTGAAPAAERRAAG